MDNKRRTRQLIELGGLVTIAKLDKYSKNILMGALTKLEKSLEQSSELKLEELSILGKKIFNDRKRIRTQKREGEWLL